MSMQLIDAWVHHAISTDGLENLNLLCSGNLPPHHWSKCEDSYGYKRHYMRVLSSEVYGSLFDVLWNATLERLKERKVLTCITATYTDLNFSLVPQKLACYSKVTQSQSAKKKSIYVCRYIRLHQILSCENQTANLQSADRTWLQKPITWTYVDSGYIQ